MGFMERQIEYGDWIEIDGPMGTEVIPAELVKLPETDNVDQLFAACRDYCENSKAYTVQTVKGWGARLSAPGYLDCTPWTVFETEEEARAYIAEECDDEEGEE